MLKRLLKSSLFKTAGFAFFFAGAVVHAQSSGNIPLDQANASANFILTNIAPYPLGTVAGVVVASPSHVYPNDFFYRVVDGAIAMDYVNRLYVVSQLPVYSEELLSYAQLTRTNQTSKFTLLQHAIPFRSLDDSGVAVPKFNADGTPMIPAPPGPENDAPALRATTLIHTARILLNKGQFSPQIRMLLYDGKTPSSSAIKVDLDYIVQHWNDPSYDLWGEIKGRHFFTLMVERRAMLEGAQLAQQLGDERSVLEYTQTATAITGMLPSFVTGMLNSPAGPIRGVIQSSQGSIMGTVSKPSGLDIATILGVLLGSAGDGVFTPSNDQVLATAYALQQAFIIAYPLNRTISTGTGIGRYPEDLFNGFSNSGGANPWFLATLAYAELCYRAAGEFQHAGVIRVSALNKQFLDEAIHNSSLLQPGATISANDDRFPVIIKGLAVMGDSFLKTVLAHRGSDGSLSEQFRLNGYQVGAINLTWSHVAFENAYNARAILQKIAFTGH